MPNTSTANSRARPSRRKASSNPTSVSQGTTTRRVSPSSTEGAHAPRDAAATSTGIALTHAQRVRPKRALKAGRRAPKKGAITATRRFTKVRSAARTGRSSRHVHQRGGPGRCWRRQPTSKPRKNPMASRIKTNNARESGNCQNKKVSVTTSVFCTTKSSSNTPANTRTVGRNLRIAPPQSQTSASS